MAKYSVYGLDPEEPSHCKVVRRGQAQGININQPIDEQRLTTLTKSEPGTAVLRFLCNLLFKMLDGGGIPAVPSARPVQQPWQYPPTGARLGRVHGRPLQAGVSVNKQDGSLFEVALNSRPCQNAMIMLRICA
jgi:hypothetical protein